MRFVALGLLVFAFGCDPAPTEDAGIDGSAPPDARVRTDAPAATCEPGCAVGQTCCAEPLSGGGICYALRSDVRHCGGCNVDCLSTDRGDACFASQCACGDDRLGCLGTRESFCCPPRPGSTARYCANLDQDATNCGGCNAACDVARSDRCDGGGCVCGATRTQCDGTPTSRCCQDGADIGCVDTTSDRFHCGGCNVLCQGDERCESGSCTRGAGMCEGGCAAGQICCGGGCCARNRCAGNVCTVFTADAGAGDGGTPDAAAPDAAAPDAAVPDASMPDAATSDAGGS